ncbi:MAG: thioredoxin family protein [Bacilli bacterium]|nr:thioredoxin family protein [Bacilli bacterium]
MKIIKIGAIWCPGCLVMKKVWKNIEKENELNIKELDYDIDKEEVEKYNIGNILPVIIFLNDKEQELERLIGEQKEEKILEIINKYRG